jgi:Leucine-rich repeat (LRR) protein
MFVQLQIIICLLFYFVNRIETAIFCNISENEYNALNALYIFTNGSNWRNKINKWIFPSDLSKPCSTLTKWHGLRCINFTSSICAISEINLIYNELNGIIPTELGNLDNLNDLDLSNNQLIGLIPTQLGNLDKLIKLGLYNNSLNGVIPTQLGNLHILNYLGLYNNQLSGLIPTQLVNLDKLTNLNLANNQLNGVIPTQLGNLHILNYFDLSLNQLNGVIPTQLGNLHMLNYFDLSFNQLNGVIPTQLGNLDKLTYLVLNNNQLSGLIPTQLGNLDKLLFSILYLNNNQLSGGIPTELGNLDKLTYLNIFDNQLNGVIPTQLGNLDILGNIDLNNNQLSGLIPTQLGNLDKLTNLNLANNSLNGVIPTQLGYLHILNYLDLSFNQLSGTIPSSFNQLNNIKVLFLTSNKLTCNLDGIFDSNYQNNLTNIDLVDNYLTGSIPSNIFGLKSLKTFAISNNCISGSLPIEICSSTTLKSLILDGIHANCRKFIFPIFPFIKTFYATSDIIEGGIPTCVFNMTNLTTLHVSGNSIKGTLDKDIVLSNKLTNLDLSTNLFSGEIPNVIQNYQWKYLNLGFNKFQDTIDNSLPSAIQSNSSTLILKNNRISGLIPSSLNSFDNINILEGNIFSCSSILPSNDPNSVDYQCGTRLFYILLLSFSFVTIVIILIKLRFYSDVDNIIQNIWYKNINRLRITGKEIQRLKFLEPLSSIINNDNSLMNSVGNDDSIIRISDGLSYQKDSSITLLFKISENLQLFLICIVLFNIFFWLLSSIILHQYYSTYDFMYGYNLSMTFLSGLPSTIVLILLITISIIFIYILMNRIVFQSPIVDNIEIDKVDKNLFFTNHFWLFLLVFIINMIVMVVVNGLFVITSLNPKKYKNNIEIFAIFLSIFKTIWKSFVLPLLLSILITNESKGDDRIKSMYNKYSKIVIIFQCVLGILNFIIIPLFANSFLSTNCFYYTLIPQDEITSYYSYQECNVISNSNGMCIYYKDYTRTSSFQPPFEYSYQCVSTLMTTYCSFYIYMSILLIMEPLLVPLIKVCYSKIKENEGLEKMMNKLIPSSFKPLESSLTSKMTKKNRMMKTIFINQTQFIVNIVIFITLYVTVGFMLPLIGIIMCISLYLYIHSILSNIGGKLTNATIDDKEKLEKECENLFENLNMNLNRYIYPIMGIFLSLLVFDTVGDKSGSDVAIFYLTLTLLIPLILWLIKRLYLLYYNKYYVKSNELQEGMSLQNIRNSDVKNPLNNNI